MSPADADRLADHDPVEPPATPLGVTEARPATPGLFEARLHGVGGIRGVTTDQASETEQPVVMLDDERLEREIGRDRRA